jgi:plastocyanin
MCGSSRLCGAARSYTQKWCGSDGLTRLNSRLDRIIRLALLAALFMTQSSTVALARTIAVEVVGPDGDPVADVVVYATYNAGRRETSSASAVMDQVDTRFVPHILAVQKGTSVEFPNSDVVAHHVYSFSKPNEFVLSLYKGDPHDPITFEHDGIVTLGCNIHDDMLAYIVVVDTDAFGKTDAGGTLNLVIDDNATNIAVHIWSPRVRDQDLTRLVDNDGSMATFRLKKTLRPPHEPGSEAVHWSEY